jgi:rSAM/selenodomain-associated transferase 1
MTDPSPSGRLIVFTRYPEPGKTKTRLIPVLGAEKAAELQRQLTERTLAQVSRLQQRRSLSVTIYYAGGDLDLMAQWLGSDWELRPQSEGDLGQRMEQAFGDAFTEKMAQVVIIGIDCPDLDVDILESAFLALDRYDCVLGETIDGGYYLLGMGHFLPSLFEEMPWGSDRVFKLTEERIYAIQLSLGYLPVLRDLDRPEDVKDWQAQGKNRFKL